eukprot:scaffold356245_cov51-Prasinocladus_malaysianus.AAC.1
MVVGLLSLTSLGAHSMAPAAKNPVAADQRRCAVARSQAVSPHSVDADAPHVGGVGLYCALLTAKYQQHVVVGNSCQAAFLSGHRISGVCPKQCPPIVV